MHWVVQPCWLRVSRWHAPALSAKTVKPPLHGTELGRSHRQPLAATPAPPPSSGWNAVDACAMIAATSTMWDTPQLGRRDAAAIYNPHTGKVIGVNALGAADRRHAGVLQEQGLRISAGVRAARGGYAGHGRHHE
jgi:hypothetical protein